MLRELLLSLNAQATNDVFSYRVRVVDNDGDRSAFPVLNEFSALAKIPVSYDVEPRQNIALARNRAVSDACSDFIALIDDDESPSRDWLLHLFRAIETMKVDAGPGTGSGALSGRMSNLARAKWPLPEAELCHREASAGYRETRTGNVLLRTRLLGSAAEPFRRDFGCEGGEDVDFFRRKAAEGARVRLVSRGVGGTFRSSGALDAAVLPEPQLQVGGRVMFRRRYRTERLRVLPGLVKAASAIVWHALHCAWSLPLGRSAYSIGLVKMAYHSGFIAAAMGFSGTSEDPKCTMIGGIIWLQRLSSVGSQR